MMDDAGIDACVLMGWSMGVNTMFEVAVTHPERVTGLFAVGGVPGDTFASMLAPIFVPRPIRKPITVNAARLMKLAGKPLTQIASRLPVGPLTYAVLSHSGFMLPMPDPELARRAIKEFLTTPIDWYMHLALHSSLHQRVSLRTIEVPTSFLAGKLDILASSHDMRTAADADPRARRTTRSGPPTSSRWRSRPRSTRRCSTCSTASPSRDRSLVSRHAAAGHAPARPHVRAGRLRRRQRARGGRDARRLPHADDHGPEPSESTSPSESAAPRAFGAAEGDRHGRPQPRGAVGHRVPARRLRAGHRARQRPGLPDRQGQGRRGRSGRGGTATARRGCSESRCRRRTSGTSGCSSTPPPATTTASSARRSRTAGSGKVRPILTGIPKAGQPRRRSDDLRAGRLAVRLDRRGRAARARPGHGLARRQDPADRPGRQAGRGQPRPVVADLDLGSPQRAGPRLRPRGQPVGLRVRPGHLGRAQPDQARLQLRLARGRGQGQRQPGLHRPAGAVAHRRRLPLRAGVRRRPALPRRAAR